MIFLPGERRVLKVKMMLVDINNTCLKRLYNITPGVYNGPDS